MVSPQDRKDFFGGNYLKADDCKNGDVATFLDDGVFDEIKKEDGSSKKVLNFQVEINGKTKIWTPNKSNFEALQKAFPKSWIGKSFTIELVKTKAFGKVQNSIIAVPIEDIETKKI